MAQLNQSDYKMKIIKDLGRIYPTENSKQLKRMGVFACVDCNVEVRITTQDAKVQKYCKECKYKHPYKTHGNRYTRLYRIWSAMKTRATNPNTKTAYRYVGRGITICDEWNNSYIVFKKWSLLNGYTDDLTIDRQDNNGNYEPNNCRWVTQSVQMSNTNIVNKSTGYRCVFFRKESGKYRSFLSYEGIKHFICDGQETPKEAAEKYNKYVIENNLPHTLNNMD